MLKIKLTCQNVRYIKNEERKQALFSNKPRIKVWSFLTWKRQYLSCWKMLQWGLEANIKNVLLHSTSAIAIVYSIRLRWIKYKFRAFCIRKIPKLWQNIYLNREILIEILFKKVWTLKNGRLLHVTEILTVVLYSKWYIYFFLLLVLFYKQFDGNFFWTFSKFQYKKNRLYTQILFLISLSLLPEQIVKVSIFFECSRPT